MEQRPLRLGNLVDDYCPRERRVTNHVIVAIVDDEIRQTRCSTCEAEHAYRAAQVPRRRKKEGATALYDEVLASVAGSQLVAPRQPGSEPPDASAAEQPAVNGVAASHEAADRPPVANLAAAPPEVATREESNGHIVDDRPDDAWPANRQLIRATLPRTDNDPPTPRPIPEFTMHQRQSRGGHGFRHGQGWHGQGGNGNGRNGFRSGRPGGGQGQGQGHGQRHGHGRGPGQGRPGQGGGQPDGNRGGQGRGGRRSR